LAQIATLQYQQEALGDRIDSLSQTADSAMEREREAEMRLDQALSVHGKWTHSGMIADFLHLSLTISFLLSVKTQ
jgi:phage shock protein A